MASWAAIAKAEPVKQEAKHDDVIKQPRVAVVDANAIINGEHLLSLMRFNDKLVTVPEVLREVRDKQSRQTLQNLPYTIQTEEPSEESVKSVMRFARATGDSHSLSSVDVRLLALAHTLEVHYNGSAHLRTQPPPPKVAKKKARDSKHLPGWGAEGGDWAELDKLNEEELAAAEAALMAGHTSRIATTLQHLPLGEGLSMAGMSQNGHQSQVLREGPSALAGAQKQQQHERAVAASGATQPPVAPPHAEDEHPGLGAAAAAQQAQQRQEEAGREETGAAGGDDGSSESEGSEGEDEWTQAARTKNVQRRQRRRELRRAQRQAEAQAEAELAAAHLAKLAVEDGSTGGSDESSEEWDSEGGSSEGEEEEEEEGEGGGSPAHPASRQDSAVCSVTADFAMQNVLLQMGLRLVTPDGRRVSSLSRWVLRCTACYGVTKEMGRLFCPRCGNASLDKVRVVVGPDGAEQYGVRKKHVLRGTKFSLPKPKGGRYNDVILREDQLLAKAHRLRKKKGAQEELDPFAPEYTDETWHTFQAAAVQGGNKGAQALLAGWKHNPNERKHVATNRRRK